MATPLISVNLFAIIALASVYWLTRIQWVAGERYWVISRAAAIAAFLVLTVVVAIGLVLSHPRNKDRWRLTPKLLPWHQALMAALFSLIGLHIFFTAIDTKSGISGLSHEISLMKQRLQQSEHVDRSAVTSLTTLQTKAITLQKLLAAHEQAIALNKQLAVQTSPAPAVQSVTRASGNSDDGGDHHGSDDD